MIAYQPSDIKTFLSQEFKSFSQIGNLVMVIVDPYFGGRKPALRDNVAGFLDFIWTLTGDIRFIWFCNEDSCSPMNYPQVESFNLAEEGISVHDRFLVLFDGAVKKYIYHFHLGGSLNGIDWTETTPFSLMRISLLPEDEVTEMENLMQRLDMIYTNKSGKSNWGCL
ncbi:hypothetical protein [Planomicrobium okeanokoites]|uniref:hypothetical protein n=1 Tax=Planomicrobium okeanokoites TaxID=244 RepID=UPI0024938E86|nr:hypothetical protein [Planomicrobium okeanokoites]